MRSIDLKVLDLEPGVRTAQGENIIFDDVPFDANVMYHRQLRYRSELLTLLRSPLNEKGIQPAEQETLQILLDELMTLKDGDTWYLGDDDFINCVKPRIESIWRQPYVNRVYPQFRHDLLNPPAISGAEAERRQGQSGDPVPIAAGKSRK